MSSALEVEILRQPPTAGWVEVICSAREGHTEYGAVRFRAPEVGAGEFAPGARTATLTWLLPAMRRGLPLRVEAPLDPVSRAQLMLWQEAMASWHPDRLAVVPIDAPAASHPPARPTDGFLRALTTFSGGVDSCHTLWRHRVAPGAGGLRVEAGLLVHGLDIRPSHTEAYAGALARVRGILEPHGVRALALFTDIRRLEKLFGLSWERQAHGIFLAACLACFESAYEAVLIPATYLYPRLVLPWGSNPVTDPLLGGAIPYLHDGAAANKLEKVRDIAADAPVQEHLRVCWEGTHGDRNCGRCFKCLSTQACYWLAGVEHPAAFDTPAAVGQLAGLPIKNAVNHLLVHDLWQFAEAQGREDVARALAVSLRRGRWLRESHPLWQAGLWRVAGSVIPRILSLERAHRTFAYRKPT
ncbi:MAG: hypothetical protein MJE66_10135 [Proteobacteria bacterium]|nr:hypothetical protein [Pseudomonadota bacterium]